jgi:hypothetical protein
MTRLNAWPKERYCGAANRRTDAAIGGSAVGPPRGAVATSPDVSRRARFPAVRLRERHP